MDIERETIVEIAATVVPVIVFIGLLVVVGSNYSTNGDLTQTGGYAVVGLLVLFILAMGAVGYWLAVADY
jgi:uncharacterized membrane protein YdbT with pleckstrin-like domain